jgi:hypothetical protein
MLPLQRWLSPDQASTYLCPYRGFRTRGSRMGMDVDPQVLAYGSNSSGAGVFTGGRVPSLALENPRGSTFIEGDLLVDGWLENLGGRVLLQQSTGRLPGARPADWSDSRTSCSPSPPDPLRAWTI